MHGLLQPRCSSNLGRVAHLGQNQWNRALLPGSHPAEASVHPHFLPAGQLVELRLLATVYSGLFSAPSAWASIKIPLSPEQFIGKWETQVDTLTKKRFITWEKSFAEGEIQVLLARDQQRLQTQKAVKSETKQLLLSNLIPGNTYRLVLRLVSPWGAWLTETRTLIF